MDPRLFLTVAQTLVESVRPSSTAPSRPCEAECRSAAGRAYYAAFLTAHEFLFWTGVRVLKNAGCHTGVQYALNNSGHAILRQQGHHRNLVIALDVVPPDISPNCVLESARLSQALEARGASQRYSRSPWHD